MIHEEATLKGGFFTWIFQYIVQEYYIYIIKLVNYFKKSRCYIIWLGEKIGVR